MKLILHYLLPCLINNLNDVLVDLFSRGFLHILKIKDTVKNEYKNQVYRLKFTLINISHIDVTCDVCQSVIQYD